MSQSDEKTYDIKKIRITETYRLFSLGNTYKTNDLAKHFGVTQKTISDEIKSLVEHGVLVRQGHSYIMPEEFRPNHIYEEADMSASIMHSMFIKAIPQLQEDVKDIFHHYPKNSNLFYFDFNMETICDEDLVSQIVVAINKSVDCEFDYIDKSSNITHKRIFPLKIANFDGNWYLIGYDLLKDKIRTYHLKQISDFTILDENSILQKHQALKKEADKIYSAWYDSNLKTVTLKVEGIAVEYISRKKYPNIDIIEQSEDKLILKMHYYNNIEVMQLMKKWLSHITIEDNNELEKEYKDLLTSALSQL